MSLFQLKKEFLLFFSPGNRLVFISFLVFLLILPLLFSGCLAYSLDQKRHGSLPAVQAEGGIGDKNGVNNNDEDINRQEEGLAERLAQEEEKRQVLEERRKLEEKRKKELGSFYVPLPPLVQKENPPVKARGIYLTGNTVGHSRYGELLNMIETTELNAVVIDVKNDHGKITYDTDIDIVRELEAHLSAPIKDLKAVLDELHGKGIYPIARIVVFKDPYLAELKPEWSIQRKSGGLWRDRDGVAWINPYEKKVWDYNIAVAREVALLGFREIQFDYIRFPENAHLLDLDAYYPGEDLSKEEVIRDFLIYAAEQMDGYNVYLAADVFGVIATSWGDSDRIGQAWEEMSPYVDYICPMVYPSHYGPGYFGLSVPDAHPGETVGHALTDALKRNAALKKPAIIRPWLQGFTATSWVKGAIPYGPAEIRMQIETALKLGIDEYLLWNAGNRYQPASFLTTEEADNLSISLFRARAEAGEDALGRTPQQAVECFLEALQKRDWKEAYALQITDYELNHLRYPNWKDQWVLKPVFYEFAPTEVKPDPSKPVFVDFSVHLSDKDNEFKLLNESWEVRMENRLWRVRPSAEFLELLISDRDNGDSAPGLASS